MGGIGSGNRWQSGRATCEGTKRIDLRYMTRAGLFRPPCQGSLSWTYNGDPCGSIRYAISADRFTVEYRCRTYDDEWHDVLEHIPLEQIAQPFGGHRYFFRCMRCRRRCLVLYGGRRFRCRKCLNLAYRSQSGDVADRAVMQMQKICKRLHTRFEDEFDFVPPRPKGMHHRTYEMLVRRHDAYHRRYEGKLAELMFQARGLL